MATWQTTVCDRCKTHKADHGMAVPFYNITMSGGDGRDEELDLCGTCLLEVRKVCTDNDYVPNVTEKQEL